MRLNDLSMLSRLVEFSKDCLSCVDSLVKLVRYEYRSGKIDLQDYERHINLLTILKLQVEEMDRIAREQVKKGVFIDARV